MKKALIPFSEQVLYSLTSFIVILFISIKFNLEDVGIYSLINMLSVLSVTILNGIYFQNLPFIKDFEKKNIHKKYIQKINYFIPYFFILVAFILTFIHKIIIENSINIKISFLSIYLYFISSLFSEYNRKLLYVESKYSNVFLMTFIKLFFISILFFKNNLSFSFFLNLLIGFNIFQCFFRFKNIFIFKSEKDNWANNLYLYVYFRKAKVIIYNLILNWIMSDSLIYSLTYFHGILCTSIYSIIRSIFNSFNILFGMFDTFILFELKKNNFYNNKKMISFLTFFFLFIYLIFIFLFIYNFNTIMVIYKIENYNDYYYSFIIASCIPISYFFYKIEQTKSLSSGNLVLLFSNDLLVFIPSIILSVLLIFLFSIPGTLLSLVVLYQIRLFALKKNLFFIHENRFR